MKITAHKVYLPLEESDPEIVGRGTDEHGRLVTFKGPADSMEHLRSDIETSPSGEVEITVPDENVLWVQPEPQKEN